MSRFDVLKSLVRSSADQVVERAKNAAPAKRLRQMGRELVGGHLEMDETALSRAAASFPEVSDASVTARRGALRFDVGVGDELLVFSLRFDRATFAPQGAKELVFEIEPAEMARNRRAREVVGYVLGAIAARIWTAALGGEMRNLGPAIVDRDGVDRVRADLRSVPAIQKALQSPARAVMIEAFGIRTLEPEEGKLAIKTRLGQGML